MCFYIIFKNRCLIPVLYKFLKVLINSAKSKLINFKVNIKDKAYFILRICFTKIIIILSLKHIIFNIFIDFLKNL